MYWSGLVKINFIGNMLENRFNTLLNVHNIMCQELGELMLVVSKLNYIDLKIIIIYLESGKYTFLMRKTCILIFFMICSHILQNA